MNRRQITSILGSTLNLIVVSVILSFVLGVFYILLNIALLYEGCYEINGRRNDIISFVSFLSIAVLLATLAFRKFKHDYSVKIPLLLASAVYCSLSIQPGLKSVVTSNYVKAFKSSEWNTRPNIQMARDLIENERLIGLSHKEVYDLIGNGTPFNLDQDTSSRYYYVNAPEYILNLTYMQLKFSHEKVVSAKLYCLVD